MKDEDNVRDREGCEWEELYCFGREGGFAG